MSEWWYLKYESEVNKHDDQNAAGSVYRAGGGGRVKSW